MLGFAMKTGEKVVSKGEFAQICNVSPGRVTQWIHEGKIGSDALVGEGRSAKIIVGLAQRQVRARTDSGQAFGTVLPDAEPRFRRDPHGALPRREEGVHEPERLVSRRKVGFESDPVEPIGAMVLVPTQR